MTIGELHSRQQGTIMKNTWQDPQVISCADNYTMDETHGVFIILWLEVHRQTFPKRLDRTRMSPSDCTIDISQGWF